MKNILKLTIFILIPISACEKNNSSNSSANEKTVITKEKTGVTVAGGNGAGSAANQLSEPADVFVDISGNIFVADAGNHRIQKWVPGATSGTTVAGGNGRGYGLNQLNNPQGIFVDKNGTIYIADSGNHRIQKWTAGATSGIMVAGRMSPTGPLNGTNNDQFSTPSAVFVDASDNIYVADEGNSRIQKWVPGATTGSTVAGMAPTLNNPHPGDAANQLKWPKDVYVDSNGTIFISDYQNCRIQKWTQGSTTGVTIAGQNKPGNAADFLAGPTNLVFDSSGNMFISDFGNHRIQKWAPNASSGTTVAGGTVEGSSSNLLSNPQGVFVDQAGNIYIADKNNRRIQKWEK
jgi:hypothetical protein